MSCPFVPWPCLVKLLQEGCDLLQGGLKAPGGNWKRASKSFLESGSGHHICVYPSSNFRVSIMDQEMVSFVIVLIVLSNKIGDMWWWIWIKNSGLNSLHIALLIFFWKSWRVLLWFCVQRPMTLPTIPPDVYFFPLQRSSWSNLSLFGIPYIFHIFSEYSVLFLADSVICIFYIYWSQHSWDSL